MSDEDHDIDIESDDDDTCSSVGGEFLSQVDKKAHHNALERKRRDHIKESFSSLRDAVPSMPREKVGSSSSANAASASVLHANDRSSDKMSRAQILKEATDYIQLMSKKNVTVQHDIEDMRKQNRLLEQQVRLLERTKSAGVYCAQNSFGTASLDGTTAADSSDSSDVDSPDNRPKKQKLASVVQ